MFGLEVEQSEYYNAIIIIIIIIIITKHLYSALQRTQHLKHKKRAQKQGRQLNRKQVCFKGTPEGRHRLRFPQIHRKLIPKLRSSHQER